jgi:wobble nucleotide-excising tRNase
MIRKIKRIRQFGVFEDFTATADLADFAIFNLLYGWNGSGKTTLSKLLHLLETKVADPEYPNFELELLSMDNTVTRQNSLSGFTGKVFVFNQPFVEENIDWKKQGAKSIVVIAEDKIEDRNMYFDIKDKQLPASRQETAEREKEYAASDKEKEEFLTAMARSLKQSLQLIDTKDARYLNYDKGKLRKFIADNDAALKDGISPLSTAELDQLRKKVSPVQKPVIDFTYAELKKETWVEAEKKVNSLLGSSIVTESIDRLQQHPDLNNWVQQGLELHKAYESENCEFCGNVLAKDRLSALEKHFNAAYADLMRRLNAARKWLEEQSLDDRTLDSGALFEEFQSSYAAAAGELAAAITRFRAYITSMDDALAQKLASPFDSSQPNITGAEQAVADILACRTNLLALIARHNEKSINFQTEVTNSKNTLELHYVADAVSEKKYFDLVARIETEKTAKDAASAVTARMEVELARLEASLANVAKGAESFNRQLQDFLGRGDISLEYDATAKGYKIMRTGTKRAATNLSEGEKTAIAFVYFTIKLTENGNRVEDSIVVVDDPISSFDSNHLFHCMSFLKAACETAKQLFILTHNFQYFKLVRDWILNKNKRDKIKSCVYAIEIEKTTPRNAVINNAHASLLNYGSEYHYLFKKLHEFKADPHLDVDQAYQVANYGRKLLEAFLSFKHPKSRDNFSQLMDDGCKQAGIDAATKDKVYRFINKYSHNQTIDFHDSPVDNLLGEGENMTRLIFAIMEKSDKEHFDEMQEICNN